MTMAVEPLGIRICGLTSSVSRVATSSHRHLGRVLELRPLTLSLLPGFACDMSVSPSRTECHTSACMKCFVKQEHGRPSARRETTKAEQCIFQPILRLLWLWRWRAGAPEPGQRPRSTEKNRFCSVCVNRPCARRHGVTANMYLFYFAGGQPREHSWLPNEEGYATADTESDQLRTCLTDFPMFQFS